MMAYHPFVTLTLDQVNARNAGLMGTGVIWSVKLSRRSTALATFRENVPVVVSAGADS
jgi:hypothetical protein